MLSVTDIDDEQGLLQGWWEGLVRQSCYRKREGECGFLMQCLGLGQCHAGQGGEGSGRRLRSQLVEVAECVGYNVLDPWAMNDHQLKLLKEVQPVKDHVVG